MSAVPTSTRFDIDLTFEVQLPVDAVAEEGSSAPDPAATRVTGTIRAAGREIVVHCDRPDLLLLSGMNRLNLFRGIAEVLASRDTSVALTGDEGLVVRMGKVKSPPLQRLLARSRHVEFGSSARVAAIVTRARAQREAAPPASLLPPETLFPLVPTLNRRIVRRVTTTNYAFGSGQPRLFFALHSAAWDGRPPRSFDLEKRVTVIGSDAQCDLVLPGAQPIHAEIRHTPEDEYVLFAFGPVGAGIDPKHTTAAGAAGGVLLRTGARIQIGDWRMAFFREEYADHGRPYGGRAGGEWSHQRPQPPRAIVVDPAE